MSNKKKSLSEESKNRHTDMDHWLDSVCLPPENTKEKKLERLKKSFGGIKSNVYVSPEDMRRENLYDDDGRL